MFLSDCLSQTVSCWDQLIPPSSPPPPPDWGWGDLSLFARGNVDAAYHLTGTYVRTPNLDQLANDGTLYTDFHVAQAFCAPSMLLFAFSLPFQLLHNKRHCSVHVVLDLVAL